MKTTAAKKDLKVVMARVETVHPWDQNPKLHDIDAIIESVKRFGIRHPIDVQIGTRRIIAGHGRFEAFKELGYTTVPIIEHDLPDDEAAAFALIDNQTTIAAGWDTTILADVINELNISPPDLDFPNFGFEDKFLEGILVPDTEEDDFEPPGDDTPPITTLGTLYVMGKHRLLCGDALKSEDTARLMDGKDADMVFTDPPYNFKVDWIEGHDIIENDDMSDEDFLLFLEQMYNSLDDIMRKGACYYIMAGTRMLPPMMRVHPSDTFYLFTIITWDRKVPSIRPHTQDWLPIIEFIAYGWKSGKGHFFNRTAALESNVEELTNLWSFAGVRGKERVHTTEKPIALAANAIVASSKKGWIIVDLFAGSGSTLIAAEQLNRICYSMELDPKYCDVIVARWETFTGSKAERLNADGTGGD